MSFTQIPDALIDECGLNVYELAHAVFICRKTMGWGKRTDGISLSQFEKALSVSRNTAIKTLRSLEAKQIISVTAAKKANGAADFNRYGFTDLFIDRANSARLGSSRNEPGVVHEMNRGSSRDELGVVHEMNTQDKPITKQTNIKTSANLSDDKSGQRKAKPVEPVDQKLTGRMIQELLKLNPEMKTPNMEAWGKVFRLMRERDNRLPNDIWKTFYWATNDHFWQGNILSPTSLRKNFDKLTVQMNKQTRTEHGAGNGGYGQTVLSDGERNQQQAEQWAEQHYGGRC